jgi:hypothetical protein
MPMMEDDFYATIKLKCGDEIFAKVAASDEGDKIYLVITNPIVLEEIRVRGKMAGYKLEPWLKTSTEDMFILELDDILTMSESSDIEMITNYQEFVRRSNQTTQMKPTKKMGYISTVSDAKEILEKLYNL